jgi:hypothetical protein
MGLVANPLGPNPVYNNSTQACDMTALSGDGLLVLSKASEIAGRLTTIVNALGGLCDAGAWLGPSASGAQQLFDYFDTAAKTLFKDDPPGPLVTIGASLRRAGGAQLRRLRGRVHRHRQRRQRRPRPVPRRPRLQLHHLLEGMGPAHHHAGRELAPLRRRRSAGRGKVQDPVSPIAGA